MMGNYSVLSTFIISIHFIPRTVHNSIIYKEFSQCVLLIKSQIQNLEFQVKIGNLSWLTAINNQSIVKLVIFFNYHIIYT